MVALLGTASTHLSFYPDEGPLQASWNVGMVLNQQLNKSLVYIEVRL